MDGVWKLDMNVLFLTISTTFQSACARGIYPDLLREFVKNGHQVYVVSPAERRCGEETHLIEEGQSTILRVKTGNIQKTNLIEKGVSTVLLESQFIAAIRKHFSDVKFDLVMYSTPPVTLAKVVQFVKKRDGAKSYLLLKDIFPQNAVDLGMMSKNGAKSLLYHFFRAKEKKLYALSDRIGCMSQANVDFLLRQDPWLDAANVEVCPNSVEPMDMAVTAERRAELREKYGVPQDKKVFIYGGNLGRPQGIPFLIDCLRASAEREDAFFVICGTGTEYPKLKAYVDAEKPSNVLLINGLPKADYEDFVAACDVGMIFLDYRFTIPNFPSRLLSYMQSGLPVLCCTDPNTDVGDVAVEGGFGWKCMSNDVSAFCEAVDEAMRADLTKMGAAGKDCLMKHYTAEQSYHTITRK